MKDEPMTPALLVEDLTVSWQGRTLIDKISFSIEPSEQVALLGASGSGKSLTAAAILGQLPSGMYAQGRIRVNGEELALSRRRPGSSNITAIHQNPMAALNPMVRLGVQIGIPLRKSGLSAKESYQQAIHLLADMGIEEPERAAASFSGELSGGQLQRVCIALALACRSSILIADECTTALDVVSQAKVLDLFRRTACPQPPHSPAWDETPALLFITHDIAAAATICSRALVLEGGRIVDEGPMETIIHSPTHPFTRQLVEAALETPEVSA